MAAVEDRVVFFRPDLLWHRVRRVCFCSTILALIHLRTVNVAARATVLPEKASDVST